MTWIYYITGLSVFIIYTLYIYSCGIRKGIKFGHEITMDALDDHISERKKDMPAGYGKHHYIGINKE